MTPPRHGLLMSLCLLLPTDYVHACDDECKHDLIQKFQNLLNTNLDSKMIQLQTELEFKFERLLETQVNSKLDLLKMEMESKFESVLDRKLNLKLDHIGNIVETKLNSKFKSVNRGIANIAKSVEILDGKYGDTLEDMSEMQEIKENRTEGDNVCVNSLILLSNEVKSEIEIQFLNLTDEIKFMREELTVAKSELNIKLDYIKNPQDARHCPDGFTEPDSTQFTDGFTEPASTQFTDGFTQPDAVQCPGGFFKIGSQCYKMYSDTRRTWNDSKAWCEVEGYVMATKPDDAITLRQYIMEHIGDGNVNLGARGDGSVFRWVDTDEAISNTDDLWWADHPSDVTTWDCLVLASHEFWMYKGPTQPFFSSDCTGKRRTLCQYLN
ncbi:unnamed protein product [Meganyctiphanes norvegica]|uniref:C-type lectin domain-containing protein n=1 Tax=Meganyctiphanes norvegica TaxID=48144 RepID=A0AAV2SBA8_MEGNR